MAIRVQSESVYEFIHQFGVAANCVRTADKRAHQRSTADLSSNGFDTHESVEVLTFRFEHNSGLCRLPSHTSHKFQPCDVGVL